MNLVYRHPSGGALFQGDHSDTPNIPTLDAERIRLVVFAAAAVNNHALPERFDTIRLTIDDNLYPTPEQVRQYWDVADKVSDHLVRYVLNGKSVLSTCWAGRNRSGLMSAFTLMKLGATDDQAIELVRAARVGGLSNPAFVRIIRAFNGLQRSRLVM